MTAPRLLMVMPYLPFVQKAKAEGYWVGAIWDPTLEPAPYLDEVRDAADVFVLTDFSDDEALRQVIRTTARQHAVATVYHIGREDSMVSAYEVAEELRAELNPVSAIRLLNDKLAMRQRLAQHHLSIVDFAVAPARADVPGALARVGYPAVVKPTALAGSRGVFLWREPGDHAAWTDVVDEYSYDGPFLVEEYLRGPEYSAETLSVDGRHLVAGITEKRLGPPPLFVEIGHVHPAPLPDDERRAIENLVVAFLDVCGYRFGPAHTEIIWTADGPRIVESQARLGGDRIPRLVELSTGLDIERAIFAALAGHPPAPASRRDTALVRFFTFPAGRVEQVDGLDAARGLDFVDELVLHLRPGDTAGTIRDSKSRHGYVIVSAPTPDEASARCEEVLSRLELVIDGTPARADGARGAPAIR